MNAAEIIRQSVTMKDICSHYGFEPNRAGFIHCPFHPGDRDASLKIYPNSRGWNCFGCGRGGSVIDFVEALCGVGFKEAVRIIDSTFNLGLPASKKASYREQMRFRQKYKELKTQADAAEKEYNKAVQEYEYWLNEWICADMIIRALKPKTPEDEIDDVLKGAYKNILIAGYMLDSLKEG